MWAFSLGGRSRSATNRNQAGPAAIVENSIFRCRFATLDAILVKHVFKYGIGRTVIPSRIVIEVQSDRSDRARADICTSPTTGLREKLKSNLKIRVFHSGTLVCKACARSLVEEPPPSPPPQAGEGAGCDAREHSHLPLHQPP